MAAHLDDERSVLLEESDTERSPISRKYAAFEPLKDDPIVSETEMADTSVGERLPYNDYTTIDQLHDLVKDSYRLRALHSHAGIRYKIKQLLDAASGWIAAAVIGCFTACVAFLVDVSVETVSDYKTGYCARNIFLSQKECCKDPNGISENLKDAETMASACVAFHIWSNDYATSFAIYATFALLFGIVSSGVTTLSKRSLPAPISPDNKDQFQGELQPVGNGKTIYMAAGSGIPEIKTILSGFVIPNYLDLKVLVIKAVGAVFAVSTGMCLGKEGPFVHISTCVGYLVAGWFPKYRENGRKMREILSAASAAGLSVAFGAPIGGVLFAYEEISTYFPRKVLWRAFLCSLTAAVVLKALDPNGTGKLVLFETNYGTSYSPMHYLIFTLLGVAGGIFGGTFCKLNLYWSRWFRGFWIIKNYPVLEASLIVLVTTLLQYPNPLTRVLGDETIEGCLVQCTENDTSWICQSENQSGWKYKGLLAYGALTKLVLTTVTFGVKVPSGVIIPALGGGAMFGRLVGQWVSGLSPGIFAMVGAGAFLAGVSRMTISLGVIMFELTGELEYVLPNMIAILTAKWVADSISTQGVYDVAQTVLGHPFLDLDESIRIAQKRNALVQELIPPKQTMDEITVHVPRIGKVLRSTLETKLAQLKSRGLMDAGLVLTRDDNMLQGYLAQAELDFGLNGFRDMYPTETWVRVLGIPERGDCDLSAYVDKSPICLSDTAPIEYAVEMFGKLGLRHLIITDGNTGRLAGVVIKKRLVAYLDKLSS